LFFFSSPPLLVRPPFIPSPSRSIPHHNILLVLLFPRRVPLVALGACMCDTEPVATKQEGGGRLLVYFFSPSFYAFTLM